MNREQKRMYLRRINSDKKLSENARHMARLALTVADKNGRFTEEDLQRAYAAEQLWRGRES